MDAAGGVWPGVPATMQVLREKLVRKVIPVALVVLVVAGIVAVTVRNRSRNSIVLIKVSGNVEVIDVDASFRIPGLVVSRPVDEGDMVSEGRLVARLDDTELKDDVAARKAAVQEALAALDELLNGSRPQEIREAEATANQLQKRLEELENGSRPEEITEARARLASARADLERWKLDFDRQQKLYERDVISSREFDVTRASYESAQAKVREGEAALALVLAGPRWEQVAQARAALEAALQRLSLAREGPRIEAIRQAKARLEQAQQSAAIAELRLAYSATSSPISGVVLSKNVEPGEYVAPGTPIVTIGDLVHVWLRAYINETDLGRVKLGQKARVTTDSYPGKSYEGRVAFISSQAEFTPKNVQTQTERVKLVYRIKIDIDNPKMELKAGMPADAEIVPMEPRSGASP